MFEKISKIIIPIGILLTLILTGSVLFSVNQTDKNEDIGSAPFRPSGVSVNIREDLVAGASRSGTTLNVDPIIGFDGARWTMADSGSILFGKIDQGTTNEEIISWNGMIDNTTYYTLTGVIWGYESTGNTTTTDNYKRHNSGAKLIITNDDHYLEAVYDTLAYDATISGKKTFSVLPESSLSATTSNQFTIKSYVDNIVNQGASTSTESIAGISYLATRIENASSTQWGITEPHVQQSEHATSTPSSVIASLSNGIWDVWSEIGGKISQSWLDLTEAFTFSGDFVVNNASSTITGTLASGGNITSDGKVTGVNITNETDYKYFTYGEDVSSGDAVGFATTTFSSTEILTTNDSRTDDDNADTNYDGETTAVVGYVGDDANNRFYASMDISGLEDLTYINELKVKFYIHDSSGTSQDLYFYCYSPTFDAATLTWNNQPDTDTGVSPTIDTAPSTGWNEYTIATPHLCKVGNEIIIMAKADGANSQTTTFRTADYAGDFAPRISEIKYTKIDGKVYRTDGDYTTTTEMFIGFAKDDYSADDQGYVAIDGLFTDSNLSLYNAAEYFIGSTPGSISHSGTRSVGWAVSSTSLIITN